MENMASAANSPALCSPPSPLKSGKGAPASRATANDALSQVLDVNEKIMADVYTAYVFDECNQDGSPFRGEPKVDPAELKPRREGIMAICSKIGLSCIAPRRKINVMIVGNHSAGKSSYVNWYISEHVQRASVAIETQGFTFVTSGKKRETLKGQATMQLFSHLQHELQQFAPAIFSGLQTEVSTSKERCFNLITFIDTPGLVDGSFHYPFPVEDAILAVAKHTDLIYVFFDPIGQALCDRTMNVVERLNEEHADKLRYFLSKADTVPNERDRQKVVVQITQNLSSRVRNAHAFELPSLYIPGFAPEGSKGSKIDNILEHTCEQMEQTISQNVQNNLNKLEEDCTAVVGRIDELLATDAAARKHNLRAASYGYAFLLLSLQLPLLALACLVQWAQLDWYLRLRPVAPATFASIATTCDLLIGGCQPRAEGEEDAAGLLTLPQFLLSTLALFALMQLGSRLARRYRPAYSKASVRNLRETRKHVINTFLPQKHRLYKQYLDQCSSGVE